MNKHLPIAAGALLIASTAVMAQTQLTLGTPVQGALAAGDQQLPTGEYYDEYQFQGEAGQSVSIRMDSSEFDTYIIYMDPNGANQQDNDDFAGGSGTNAGLDITLQTSGLHRVGATSYTSGTTGNYTIAVYAQGQAPAAAPAATPAMPTMPTMPTTPPMPAMPTAPTSAMTVPSTVVPVGAVATGAPVNGQLGQGDASLGSGEFIDVYTIPVTAGQTLNIQLSSPAGQGNFDTYLIYRDPSGQQQDNDDVGGGNLNSALTVTASQAGTAQIGVTSFQPGTSGNYVLSVN